MIRFILILISLVAFTSFTFAGNDIQAVSTGVYSFLNILNLIWLPLAILAGKLFTNDFVYGTFMHMDVVLWKIWNFSKNVSLIILGFALIYSIFGLFIGKTKNIWDNLLKIAFAGVLIPVSWFLIGVLVDLSTLFLVAVGSFPMKIISNQTVPSANIKYCKDIYLNPTLKLTQSKDITECKQEGGNINDFITKMNNLAGPLLYIGQSILYLDRDWGIIDKKQLEQKNQDPLKAVSLAVFFKLIVLVLFVAPLFALVLVGLIRIFWLWIYIGFSPFIVLDQVFGGKILGKKEYFKFSNMVGLIFQPVFVVFAMGVALIFLATLRNIMVVDHISGEISPGLVQLGVCESDSDSKEKKPDSFCVGNTPVITVTGNLMKDFLDNVGGFFGYLIFILLVTMILFSLLKVASKASSIISSVVDRVYKFTAESLMAVPIIPTSRGPVGLGAAKMALDKGLLKADFGEKAAEQAQPLIDKIYQLAGVEQSDLSVEERKEWENQLRLIRTEKDLIKTLVDNIKSIETSSKHKNMIIANSPYFKEALYEYLHWLYAHKKSMDALKKLGLIKKDKFVSSPEEMFANPEFRRFVTGLFEKTQENPSLLYVSDFSQLLHTIVPANYADRTNSSLSSWLDMNKND